MHRLPLPARWPDQTRAAGLGRPSLITQTPIRDAGWPSRAGRPFSPIDHGARHRNARHQTAPDWRWPLAGADRASDTGSAVRARAGGTDELSQTW